MRLCGSRAMHAYLYASTIDPDVYAFSVQATDGNLPAEYAPWRRLNSGSSHLAGPACMHSLHGQERNGYYRMCEEPNRVP
jgi:hypothetical protein